MSVRDNQSIRSLQKHLSVELPNQEACSEESPLQPAPMDQQKGLPNIQSPHGPQYAFPESFLDKGATSIENSPKVKASCPNPYLIIGLMAQNISILYSFFF